MTKDAIVALIARRQDAWDRQDARALAADYSEDCVVESPLAGGNATGRDAIERLYATYFRAFTDMSFQQDALLVEGDRAAQFARGTGTDLGGFMGMAASGRAVSFPIAFLYEFRDGVIVRERRVYDFTGVLVQVGAIKAKPI